MTVVNFDLINDYCLLSTSLGTASEQIFSPEILISYELPEAFSNVLIKQVPGLNELIAITFNYNPGSLSQMMKDYTGKSLHQYLISYRLKIAKKNLTTTDDSINIIAWKSGFQSTAYFIKAFKEQTGMTPRKDYIPFLF